MQAMGLSAFLLVPIAALALVMRAVAAEPPEGAEVRPAFEMEKTPNVVRPQSFRLNFELTEGVIGKVPFIGYFSVVDGTLVPGVGRTPDFNRASHAIAGSNVVFDGTKLTGDLTVTVKSDGWNPPDKKDRIIECALDADLVADGASGPSKPDEAWKAVGASVGKGFSVRGRVSCKPADGSAGHETAISGTLALAAGGNRWNSGSWDNGIKFVFDLGTNRVNWNHHRVAQIGFSPALNWYAYDGMRLKVRTSQPRDDAEVTVWIREADGSWYYYRPAVPLAAAVNSTVLYFSDFEEAEWVSPENHMDEDYVLDLREVSHLGIGVVNPLGVGEVGFIVEAIDLFRAPAVPEAPVEARVSGRMLSVNGHEVVPSGIFGGYAPNLPQEYRPGCQRIIRALPGGGPSDPRVEHATIRSVRNGHELFKRLSAAAVGTLDAHLWGLVVRSKGTGTADGVLVPPKNEKEANYLDLVAGTILNRLLSSTELYGETLWQGVELAGDLRDAVKTIGSGDLPPSHRMLVNRRLLSAAYPEHIAALPHPEPSEVFLIDCMGERGEPSMFVRGSDYAEQCRKVGIGYAEAARRGHHAAVMEWWNEPYLNWASTRKNLLTEFFNTNLAVEGGPVAVAWGTEKDIVPHLKWESFEYTDRKAKVKRKEWRVRDETMFTYWSGRANGYMYDKTFEAVAAGAKETNPDVQMVAGWGFRWNEDHWAAWDILYKPTIDRGIQWIDGVHEHHYQGDTTAMQGSYETMLAYTVGKYGKWVYCYNTECGELVDVPARGAADGQRVAAAKEYRNAVYNLRDILYSVCRTPDKIRSRTVIHNDHTPRGTDVAFGMMSNLRGRLVETGTSDPNVWCAASVDGTDPKAMPRKPGLTLVALIFNDHRSPRNVKVRLDAPAGTRMSAGTAERTVVDGATFVVGLERGTVQAKDNVFEADVTVAGRGAWKVAFPLEGTVSAKAQVVRRQFFAGDVVKIVSRGTPWSTVVKLDPALLKVCKRAWLRTVVESLADGEGAVKVGDKAAFLLPRAPTRDNGNRILDIPVDVSVLSAEVPLVFTLADAGQSGYRVDMASIVLETEAVE